jgi:hypothetical protein
MYTRRRPTAITIHAMSELAWLDRLLASPPRRLSELEQHVGPLEVDFATEGYGYVHRPSSTRTTPLRDGLARLSAQFHVDIFHEDPRRPRDMSLQSVRLWLSAPERAVRPMLEARFGAACKRVRDKHASYRQYGRWFHLMEADDAVLDWYAARPEWAMPVAPANLRDDFLATLVDRLACEETEPALAAALAPLARAVGVEIHTPIRSSHLTSEPSGMQLVMRPSWPLAPIATALRWDPPWVAYSGDLHMQTWSVTTLAAASARPFQPRLGRWTVTAELTDWPSGPGGAELPVLGQLGLSPLYDVTASEPSVFAIEISRDE